MTIATNLERIDTAVEDIRKAIVAKGVTVPPSTPLVQYAGKVRQIPQEGGTTPTPESSPEWVRPAGRPPLPFDEEEGPPDNTFYFLFGVQNDELSDFAVRFVGTGPITVEWGDGSIENYASNATMQHLYDYASIDTSVDATVEGHNIKWVWIKITAPEITQISREVRPSWRPEANSFALYLPRVYEIYGKATQLDTWYHSSSSGTRTVYAFLEIVRVYGKNKITSFSYFMMQCANLRRLDIDTSSSENMSSFLYGCSSFNYPLNIDTSSTLHFSSFLYGCTSFNQPLNLDVRAGLSFASFLYGCTSFNQPLALNSDSATGFGSFLSGCVSLTKQVMIDTRNVSVPNQFAFILSNARAYSHPITLDVRNAEGVGATASFAFRNIPSVPVVRLLNMTGKTLNIYGMPTSLTASALTVLFNDLYDRTGLSPGTLDIAYTFGAAKLSSEQLAIATNKNWTVIK